MDEERNDALPPGWAWAKLGEVLASPRPKIAPDAQSALPFLGLEHLPPNGRKPSGFGTFAAMRSAAAKFDAGDVLYGRLRPYLNKVWCADRTGAASAEFIVFPARSNIDGEFLALLLHDVRFVEFAKAAVSGDRPRVDVRDMAPFEFAMPPLAEQKRIAAEVKELFTQLDEVEAAVGRARERAGAYRASLLHAACTGALTADWRAANPNPNEDGPTLLRRVLAERKAARQSYKEVQSCAAQDEAFPDIPPEWVWAPISDLVSEQPRNGVSIKGSLSPPGVAALRLDALVDNGLDFSRCRYIQIPLRKAALIAIRDGDFLVSRANGSRHLVGKAAVAEQSPDEMIFPDTIIRLRFVEPALGRWIAAVWKSGLVRGQLEARAKTSAGIWKLGQDDLLAVRIPLPSLEEAAFIVQRLADERVDEVDPRADFRSLRQSILHTAFTGHLVPQDPAAEPAATLIARLRAPPDNNPAPRTRAGRPRQKASA